MSSGATRGLRIWLLLGGVVVVAIAAVAIFFSGALRRVGLGNWLPDAVHHHFVCGNGTVDPGEECEAEADCPGVTNHCNRETCQCVTCADMPSPPAECSMDEQCVELHGDEWFCNQAACNCFTCPADSDWCRSEADCPALTDHCNTALCECVTCAELGSPPAECGTDEQCVELRGAGWFCNQAACSCMTCPAGSDGCRTDADCPGEGDYCHMPSCECVTGCGDGWCDVTVENTDLCPEDCPCVDNGECEPGEGSSCADCGPLESACGAPCGSTDDCRVGLSCFDGVCWDDCTCEGRCGEEPGAPAEPGECQPCQGGSDCNEYCNSPDAWCEEGCCRCP